MKDIILTMLTVAGVAIVSTMIGVYHYPDDDLKAQVDAVYSALLIFYGTWVYVTVTKGK